MTATSGWCLQPVTYCVVLLLLVEPTSLTLPQATRLAWPTTPSLPLETPLPPCTISPTLLQLYRDESLMRVSRVFHWLSPMTTFLWDAPPPPSPTPTVPGLVHPHQADPCHCREGHTCPETTRVLWLTPASVGEVTHALGLLRAWAGPEHGLGVSPWPRWILWTLYTFWRSSYESWRHSWRWLCLIALCVQHFLLSEEPVHANTLTQTEINEMICRKAHTHMSVSVVEESKCCAFFKERS